MTVIKLEELKKRLKNNEQSAEGQVTPDSRAAPDPQLEAIAKKNKEKTEKLKKERAKANKGTLRSYRIKHDKD